MAIFKLLSMWRYFLFSSCCSSAEVNKFQVEVRSTLQRSRSQIMVSISKSYGCRARNEIWHTFQDINRTIFPGLFTARIRYTVIRVWKCLQFYEIGSFHLPSTRENFKGVPFNCNPIKTFLRSLIRSLNKKLQIDRQWKRRLFTPIAARR